MKHQQIFFAVLSAAFLLISCQLTTELGQSLLPPTGVAAQYDSVSNAVSLTWDSVQDSNLVGYMVYRRKNLSETPVAITPLPVSFPSYKDTLPPTSDTGTVTYYYQIKAQDMNGDLSVLYSNPVKITFKPRQVASHHFALISSTVALWTFNSRNNGTFSDISPNAFALSNADGSTLTSSLYDSAIVFTSTTPYLSHANTPALNISGTGKLTYEARVYMTQYPANSSGLISTYDGMRMCIWPDGRLQASGQRVSGSTNYWWSANSTVLIPLNRWVDLAIAFDQVTKQAYAYIDGTPIQLYDGSVTSDAFRVPTTPFTVGALSVGYPFTGKVDEIRISNSLVLGAGLPLSQANPVDTVSQSSSSDTISHFGKNSSTVALWTFNSAANNQIKDVGPHGFNLSPMSAMPPLVSSPFGSAMNFTGAGAIAAANSPLLTVAGTGTITLEARIYLSQYPSASNDNSLSFVVGMYEGPFLNIWSDGSLQGGGQKMSNGSGYWFPPTSDAGVVPLNRWTDVAIAEDQTTGQCYGYIDGKPIQLHGTLDTHPWRISTSQFMVGNSSIGNKSFIGKIEEVRISNSLVLGVGLPMPL